MAERESKVRYYYFGRQDVRHGVMTIAAIPDPQSHVVQFAVAYCSSADQFCKSTGRLLARARLINNGKYKYATAYNSSILQALIVAFNGTVSRKEKPQVWRDRKLCLSPDGPAYIPAVC